MVLKKLLDRENELAALDAAWSQAARGEAQLVVLWGRRRVGKTFLLSHFIEGKRAVFFGATQQAKEVELRRLAEAVARDLGSQAADLSGGTFATWEAALRFFAALSMDDPLVIVLDEVPYLAESTPGFPSIVQVVWDHLAPGTKLMLVLTGSAVGTVDRMLGSGGALRGRPTNTLRMDPVDAVRARVFLPRLDATSFMEAYAACGGYPLHLRNWDQDASTQQNLLQLAATSGGILLEDAAGILREELPDAGGYPRVLAAIGRGRSRISEIATEAAQRVEHPIDVLIRAGFVRRAVPVGAPRKARPVYEIDDPYLAFWFGVLYSDIAQIEAGQGKAVLLRKAGPWQRHLEWVFEEIARDHARRLVANRTLPENLVVGRWWTISGEPADVDILGLEGSRTRLVGEARWQARKLGMRDFRNLLAKVPRTPQPVDDPIVGLWGRSGVEPDVKRVGALGFSANDMLKVD